MMRPSGDGDACDELLVKVWADFEPAINKAVQRISKDPDTQDDLRQEALIGLWMTDPTRFDLTVERERLYVQRMMKNRMRDLCPKRRKKTEIHVRSPNSETPFL
jgi:DNA-directed RNA polymerase specialized sigma24 family protein